MRPIDIEMYPDRQTLFNYTIKIFKISERMLKVDGFKCKEIYRRRGLNHLGVIPELKMQQTI